MDASQFKKSQAQRPGGLFTQDQMRALGLSGLGLFPELRRAPQPVAVASAAPAPVRTATAAAPEPVAVTVAAPQHQQISSVSSPAERPVSKEAAAAAAEAVALIDARAPRGPVKKGEDLLGGLDENENENELNATSAKESGVEQLQVATESHHQQSSGKAASDVDISAVAEQEQQQLVSAANSATRSLPEHIVSAAAALKQRIQAIQASKKAAALNPLTNQIGKLSLENNELNLTPEESRAAAAEELSGSSRESGIISLNRRPVMASQPPKRNWSAVTKENVEQFTMKNLQEIQSNKPKLTPGVAQALVNRTQVLLKEQEKQLADAARAVADLTPRSAASAPASGTSAATGASAALSTSVPLSVASGSAALPLLSVEVPVHASSASGSAAALAAAADAAPNSPAPIVGNNGSNWGSPPLTPTPSAASSLSASSTASSNSGYGDIIIAQENDASGDAITVRFNLNSLMHLGVDHKKHVRNLIQNGLYYLTVNNVIAALAAFSSASAYVYALQISNPKFKPTLQKTMAALLGYVETLQEKTKTMCVAGGSQTASQDKKDEKEDIDIQCEAFGCEKSKNALCLTFKDVIGMGKEKQVFFDAITQPLIYPNLYTKGAKGILLYGPPGTGKTFLVKAAIREFANRYDNVKVLFFPLTGADLKGKYVGETEQKIVRAYECASRRACQMTDLYNLTGPKKCASTDDSIKKRLNELKEKGLLTDAEAKAMRPTDDIVTLKKQYESNGQFVSVLFIDEFDSIGGDRNKDETGMVANAVNTFLQMIDGTESKENVITVCATNYPWNLDGALIRRFSEQVYCNVPGFEDVKRLLVKEQEDRYKLKKRNLFDYCGNKLKKIFNPSEEIKKIIEQETEKIGCESDDADDKKKSILNAIDISYIKDDSFETMALVSEMVEKKYSNSDIANVMLKAFNAVAESSLRSSVWKVVDYETEKGMQKYCISKMTKLKQNANAQIDTELAALEENATKDSIYYDGSEGASKSRKLNISQNLYMDKEYTRSIFNDMRTVKEEELNPELMLTNIVVKKKKYTNIRFIKDLPSILMFNDTSLGDMFYNVEDIKTLNKLIKSHESSKSKSDFDKLKKSEISVVFSKSMKIDYKTPVVTDNIDMVLLNYHIKAKEYALQVVVEKTASQEQIQEFKEILATSSFLLKDFITKDKAEFNAKFSQYFDDKGPKMDDIPNLSLDSAIHQTHPLSNMMAHFSTMNIDIESKKTFLISKLTNIKAKITANTNLDLADLTKLIDCHALVNFMSPAAASLCQKGFVDLQEFTPHDQNLLNMHLKNSLNFDEFRKTKTTDEQNEEHYKVFYFHSIIKPYDGAWVNCKSGGFFRNNYQKFRNFISTYYDKLIASLFRNSEAAQKEQVIESIMARIESTKVSALRYLLNRATGVGVCDGVDDRKTYRTKHDELPAVRAVPLPHAVRPPARQPSAAPGPGAAAVAAAAEVQRQLAERNVASQRQATAAAPAPAGLVAQSGQEIAIEEEGVLGEFGAIGGKYTRKLKHRRQLNKTYKHRKETESYIQFGGDHTIFNIYWYDISKTGKAATEGKINMKTLFGSQAFMTEILKKDGKGEPSIWQKYLKPIAISLKPIAIGGGVGIAVGAAAGAAVAAGVAGLAYAGLIGGTTVSILSYLKIGAAVAGVTGAMAGSRNIPYWRAVPDFFGEIIFNDIIGAFSTIENPEDDLYIVNLMVSSIFTKDYFDVVKQSGTDFVWHNEFKPSFFVNYAVALDTRTRYFSQLQIIPTLIDNPPGDSRLNLKEIVDSKKDIKKENFLCFYMDASYIGAGMKAYPTTYNSVTGKMLNDYNRNRIKFLEDYQAGKYDKKKN